MWDNENDKFYLVNYNEKVYMMIACKNTNYYELCRHLYCQMWSYHKEYVENTFRLVDRIAQIDGCEL